MLRNRQKANHDEHSVSKIYPRESTKSREGTRSKVISSSNSSAASPIFIHYQPTQGSHLEKQYQPESLLTPRDSSDHAQAQYDFDVSSSNGINISNFPSENLFFPSEATSTHEFMSNGNYLSAMDKQEAPCFYWDNASSVVGR